MTEDQKKDLDKKKERRDREDLIDELHPEDELRVEERKLKEEKDKELLDKAGEEEIEYDQERMTPEDPKYKQELKDKKIEEGMESGWMKDEKAEEIDESIDEADELVAEDEITSAEEGFVRGYEEDEENHFHKKKKKPEE